MSFRQIYHIVQDLLNNYDQLILVMGGILVDLVNAINPYML